VRIWNGHGCTCDLAHTVVTGVYLGSVMEAMGEF
jgi:hypothetical protein